jgi:fatty-acyl-CoA synthase
VTAVVVRKSDAALDETRIIAYCASQLAALKTPKAVIFVDALPKNPRGKLLERELRLRFEDHFDR